MARHYSNAVIDEPVKSALPFPLDREVWAGVVGRLRLSPQQARIIELVLCGMEDKEIAIEMGLKKPTVRTYLDRIFTRLGARGRMEVASRIFAAMQDASKGSGCPHR